MERTKQPIRNLFSAVRQTSLSYHTDVRSALLTPSQSPAKGRGLPRKFFTALRQQKFQWRFLSPYQVAFVLASIVRYASDKKFACSWVRQVVRYLRKGYLVTHTFYDPQIGEVIIQPFVGLFLVAYRRPLNRAIASLQQKREIALAQRQGNYKKTENGGYVACYEPKQTFEKINDCVTTETYEILGETEIRAPPSRNETTLIKSPLVSLASRWLSPSSPRAVRAPTLAPPVASGWRG